MTRDPEPPLGEHVNEKCRENAETLFQTEFHCEFHVQISKHRITRRHHVPGHQDSGQAQCGGSRSSTGGVPEIIGSDILTWPSILIELNC